MYQSYSMLCGVLCFIPRSTFSDGIKLYICGCGWYWGLIVCRQNANRTNKRRNAEQTVRSILLLLQFRWYSISCTRNSCSSSSSSFRVYFCIPVCDIQQFIDEQFLSDLLTCKIPINMLRGLYRIILESYMYKL